MSLRKPVKMEFAASQQETYTDKKEPIRAVIILLLTSLAYIRTLSFEFIIDDEVLILNNPVIQSWGSILQDLNQHLFHGFDSQVVSTIYRPLWLIWERLCFSLFAYHPAGWHLSNIVLHVIATYLSYRLVKNITGRSNLALITGLIFGLHPAHAESVAWVSGGMDILATVFILCALNMTVTVIKRDSLSRQPFRIILALLCAGAAMFVKETAIITPLMAALCAGLVATRVAFRNRIVQISGITALFFLIAAAYLLLRYRVMGELGGSSSDISFTTMVLTWPYLIILYAKQLLFPINLSLYYPYTPIPVFSVPHVFGPVVLIGIASALLFLWGRAVGYLRWALLAIGFMVIPLIPVLKLDLLPRQEIIHTRYLYLPILGFAFLAALLFLSVVERIDRENVRSLFRYGGVAALIILLFTGVYLESRPYKDNFTVYSRAYQVAPANSIVRVNLANQYVLRKDYKRAVILFEEILSGYPDDWLANYNMGYTYYLLERYEKAIKFFQRSIQINPNESDQFRYMALSYLNSKNYQAAGISIHRAIQFRPEGKNFHHILGLIYCETGNYQGAEDAFQRELSMFPDSIETQEQLLILREKIL